MKRAHMGPYTPKTTAEKKAVLQEIGAVDRTTGGLRNVGILSQMFISTVRGDTEDALWDRIIEVTEESGLGPLYFYLGNIESRDELVHDPREHQENYFPAYWNPQTLCFELAIPTRPGWRASSPEERDQIIEDQTPGPMYTSLVLVRGDFWTDETLKKIAGNLRGTAILHPLGSEGKVVKAEVTDRGLEVTGEFPKGTTI